MKIHPFSITLLDPVFYSREGLVGAFSPKYLHATAINHAVAYALGKEVDQPYIMSDKEGGRNTPRYSSSYVKEFNFYFTPARPKSNVSYHVEVVKADSDKIINKRYGSIKLANGKTESRPEVLKASQLFFLSPETEFEGFVLIDDEISLPSELLIRLGSFRGKAKLEISKGYEPKEMNSNQYVNHPVDPLVSEVVRGVMINIFPYPIVDNAICRDCFEIKKGVFVAIPIGDIKYDTKTILDKINEIEKGLKAVYSDRINDIEKATLLLYMSRTILSIRLYLEKRLTQDELDSVLGKEIAYEKIRRVKQVGETLPEDIIENTVQFIKQEIKNVREKIKEKDSGAAKTSRTSQTRIF